MLTAEEIMHKYLKFFEGKGHAIIESKPVIPENDPTVLFTTAGMHPLVPFLLGQPHPAGKRLANVQKCLRTDDIDEVGDASHHTFFLMLGNWSLGDYFKKEAIEMSWEFLTGKEWLGIPKDRIAVTCFAGDADAPRDDESARVWESLGVPKERIYFKGKKDNWWGPAGLTGPCGPDTEMFYYTGVKERDCDQDGCGPGCHCGLWVEVWNDVFMEYNKTKDGRFERLSQKNVDTGMGLERTAAVMQGAKSDYETELFLPVMEWIRSKSAKYDEKSARIIADHLRAAVFVLADDRGVVPSNVEHGYILRRLIRRAIRHARTCGISGSICGEIAEIYIRIYGDMWPELAKNREFVLRELWLEEKRFAETLERGMREFERIAAHCGGTISGKDAFLLYQSYGFPIEITEELARERGKGVDKHGFEEELARHQEISREGTKHKFASGLADFSEKTVRLHTATHLLQAALRKVLGESVQQKGSNITPERLRFDFTYGQKMTPEQIRQVEDLVNGWIRQGISVRRKEETIEEAREEGALAFFAHKYGEKVSVYEIPGASKEVCTGPHVSNTSEIGHFKIVKEEAVSAGVRRIKAVVEQG
ncbi:MAG: alanine--tRNA ligase [Candidatus Micrarchaeota archaeon]|nr:alanine--tRNA ligase [Candidatus Micrarchaeota archaeon]